MKAKLVRKLPLKEGLPYYFQKYEFECIDCGEHYRVGQCNDRTNPYCADCNRKHEVENRKKRAEMKKQKMVNDVLDKVMAEIKTMSGDIETIADALKIIDKYKAES